MSRRVPLDGAKVFLSQLLWLLTLRQGGAWAGKQGRRGPRPEGLGGSPLKHDGKPWGTWL